MSVLRGTHAEIPDVGLSGWASCVVENRDAADGGDFSLESDCEGGPGIMGLSASGVAGESVNCNEVRRGLIGVTITEVELFGRAIESTPLPLGESCTPKCSGNGRCSL